MRDYSQSAAAVEAYIQVFINIAKQTLISLRALVTILALETVFKRFLPNFLVPFRIVSHLFRLQGALWVLKLLQRPFKIEW